MPEQHPVDQHIDEYSKLKAALIGLEDRITHNATLIAEKLRLESAIESARNRIAEILHPHATAPVAKPAGPAPAPEAAPVITSDPAPAPAPTAAPATEQQAPTPAQDQVPKS